MAGGRLKQARQLRQEGKGGPPTPAMVVGSVAHAYVLTSSTAAGACLSVFCRQGPGESVRDEHLI